MRLFIAVELDEAHRARIVEIQKELAEEALKLVEPENLHITLKFIGEVPDERAAEIAASLKAVKMGPFDIAIGKLGVFPNMNYIRVVWVGVDGALAELAAKVEASLQGLGYIEKDRHEFSSHLTIARVKTRPKYLGQRLQKFKDAAIGVQMVDRFFLVKSTLTPKGPIYEHIAEYKLGA